MRPLWGDEEAHTQNTKFVFEKSRSFAFTCFNALFTRRRPRTQKKVPSRRSLLHKTGGCACDERRTTTRSRELLFIFFLTGVGRPSKTENVNFSTQNHSTQNHLLLRVFFFNLVSKGRERAEREGKNRKKRTHSHAHYM